jgi:hypothetical protein
MDFSQINKLTENDILKNKEYMNRLSNILKIRQFSEDFLKETLDYYDPWICLKYQKNLSPYFCFRYLYDNNLGFADNWIGYYDIINYLSKQDKKYTSDEIEFFYKKSQIK